MTQIKAIHTGFFKLDGGAMFGVVPRKMWANLNPPDAQNMCTWAMRALLVQTGTRNILIDTGIGNKQDDKFRSHFEPHGSENLFDALSAAGLIRTDITDVFLTHLHFDHCGGALWRNEQGAVEPAFPNAVYWSNKRHWDWAMQPNPREKASFLQENFVPLLEQGRLQFLPVKQNLRFDRDFTVRFVYGHTEAMMVPLIRSEGKTYVYCADTIPSQWHVGMPYVMAYDIRPLLTLQEKARILEDAVRENQALIFEHDPIADAATLRKDAAGRIAVDQICKL